MQSVIGAVRGRMNAPDRIAAEILAELDRTLAGLSDQIGAAGVASLRRTVELWVDQEARRFARAGLSPEDLQAALQTDRPKILALSVLAGAAKLSAAQDCLKSAHRTGRTN